MRTFLTSVLLLVTVQATHAEMIKPTCWEENVNGEVHRNCKVNRPEEAHKPPPVQPHVAAAPPPQPDTYAPPAYGPPPRLPFNGRWVGPQSMPRDFGPGGNGVPYYGYGPPPLTMLSFGPFTIVVP